MCLGIPGKVVEMVEGYGGQLALVDVAGVHRKINVGLLEDGPLEPGTWVIIHMGFALERVDEAGAETAMSGLELMGQPRDVTADGGKQEAVRPLGVSEARDRSLGVVLQGHSRAAVFHSAVGDRQVADGKQL